MDTKIIAIINQKGGVGKTTTAEALAFGLIKEGSTVLSIDLDAQGNLSYTANAKTDGATIFEVLTGKVKIDEAIQSTNNGDIIAANKTLSIIEKELKDISNKQNRLKETLKDLKKEYQYIIIDTPPALSILTLNALTACHDVIIPAQADIYSLKGMEKLHETIEATKRYFNPDLRVAGILFTRYNARTILSKEMTNIVKEFASRIETKLFNSTIREGIAVREAQVNKKSLFEYAPRAKVTQDYKDFIKEYLNEG